MELKELFDKNELNRLERAVKDKNKLKVVEWGMQFENTIKQRYEEIFKEELEKQVHQAIERYMITIIFTLHFNDKLKFDEKTIRDFMQDVVATVDGFDKNEYSLEEYKQMLRDDDVLYF